MLVAEFHWDVIWTAFGALATVAVAIVAIWHEELKRPKLRISFDPDRDVQTQKNTVGVPKNHESRWLRVRVVNGPKRWRIMTCRAAKNCRAFLVRIESVRPDGNAVVFENDARQLRWMHDPQDKWEGRDLLPGIPQWVDLACTVDNRLKVQLSSYPEYELPPDPGDYLVTAQVSADEADPVTTQVLIHWAGTWESLSGRS
jgi:hypothetical protein